MLLQIMIWWMIWWVVDCIDCGKTGATFLTGISFSHPYDILSSLSEGLRVVVLFLLTAACSCSLGSFCGYFWTVFFHLFPMKVKFSYKKIFSSLSRSYYFYLIQTCFRAKSFSWNEASWCGWWYRQANYLNYLCYFLFY